jgi:hypothetical protein
MACACKEQDLFGKAMGWTGWFGPFNIDGGKCATDDNKMTNGLGYSKSWGAGFAATKCTTKKID